MPYINEEARAELDEAVRLAGNTSELALDNVGQLNYMITTLCLNYLKYKERRYSHVNAVVGAMECAKLELYRRFAAPYEDEKIKENGDIEGYVS